MTALVHLALFRAPGWDAAHVVAATTWVLVDGQWPRWLLRSKGREVVSASVRPSAL